MIYIWFTIFCGFSFMAGRMYESKRRNLKLDEITESIKDLTKRMDHQKSLKEGSKKNYTA